MSSSRAERFVRIVIEVAPVTYCRIVDPSGAILAEAGDLDNLSRPALVHDDMDTEAERATALAGFRERDLHPHVAAKGKTRGVYLFVDDDTFVQMFFDFDGDVGDFYERSTSLASLAYQIDAELS